MWALAVAGAVALAYMPVYHAGYIWDDDAHVTRPELMSLQGLWRIWFELGATQQYYPVLHSAFWLEHWVLGSGAMGYHVVNVALHATVACLFAVVLKRVLGEGRSILANFPTRQTDPAASLKPKANIRIGSGLAPVKPAAAIGSAAGSLAADRNPLCGVEWLAALLFAVHPVCVESVAWISEQKNTLSAVFYLLAAWLYLEWRNTGSSRKRLYVWATAGFVLALLAKSVTATLPGGLLVVLWWRQRKLSWRADVCPLLPWFAAGISAGLFTAWVEHSAIGAKGAQFDFSWSQRCLIAGRAAFFYLGKLLWPTHLSFIYPRWPVGAQPFWLWVYPAAALASLTVLVFARRARGLLAASLYFLGTLFPALGFVNVYPFVFSFVADHFQYLASLGFFSILAAGWGLWNRAAAAERGTGPGRPIGGVGRRLPIAAAAGAVAILGSMTWNQCRAYRNQETLYTATLRENPDCWLAHDNLGVVLEQEGRTDEAIAHYRKALILKPDYPEGYNNLGNALARIGRRSEAIDQYARALSVRPGFAVAEFDWGNALGDSGRYAEAAIHYGNALRLRHEYPEAEYRLASALANSGKIGEALAHYARAIALRPDYAEAEANLGLALAMLGRADESRAHIDRAVRLKPDYAEAHAYLGFVLAKLGRPEAAVAEFKAALRLNPRDADVHFQLASALKALGRFSEAAEELQMAERAARR
jgi:tetratricopeptide (TPR) repeat protein